MPNLSLNNFAAPNPAFPAVDEEGNPTGVPNALLGFVAPPPAPYGVPLGYLADPMAKTEPMPVFNDIDPFNPNMVETDPNMQTGLTQAMIASMMAQNQFNLGIPTSPPNPSTLTNTLGINPSTIAMHGALLGTLAHQAVVQDAMETLANTPTVNAPMSMQDALDATLAAMNPAISAPDDTSSDTDSSTSDNGTTSSESGSTGGGVSASVSEGLAASAASDEGGTTGGQE